MSDLINRQDAIDAFRKATADGDKGDFCVSVIKELPEVEAIPIGCLELEKADCAFSICTDMGSSYEYDRERACKNILEWYGSPRYQRCYEVAQKRGFI